MRLHHLICAPGNSLGNVSVTLQGKPSRRQIRRATEKHSVEGREKRKSETQK
jgi:hypothetical protein